MQTQVQKELIENAIERVKLFGMLNYLPEAKLTHIPFSLSPYSISKNELKNMKELTSYFSEMVINVSENWDFLEENLNPLAKNDPFLRLLLDFKTNEVTQNKKLLIQRNDFFLLDEKQKHTHQINNENYNDSSKSLLKQVEINTVSVSFPFLISQLCKLHQYFSEQNRFEAIVKNDPLKHLTNSFAEARKDYGYKDSIILIVTQPKESNIFDQIGLEQNLWDTHKIKTVRKSFSEIFKNCYLKNGHLILDGQIVAITYYRAGYTPNDFTEIDAIKGRKIIEASSTIQVPNLTIQLAGMKKIQQVLTNPKIISEFVSPEISSTILQTFVKMNSLDEILDTSQGRIKVSNLPYLNPDKYVLKPQREGGGNNFFGKEILEFIPKLKKEKFNTYVLMEKISPKIHPAVLVVNNKSQILQCISEIGRYGICSTENGIIKNNYDIGYLVRTKSENINEGGVCAGYACLNSIKIL